MIPNALSRPFRNSWLPALEVLTSSLRFFSDDDVRAKQAQFDRPPSIPLISPFLEPVATAGIWPCSAGRRRW